MTRTPIGACVVASALGVCPASWGDEVPRARVVEDKAALVQRVLQDSPLSRRVAASASEDARAHLARAAASHRHGVELVAAGRLDEGEAAFDAAMTSIALAGRAAPDAGRAEAAQRARYTTQRESVETLHEAVRRRAAAVGSPRDGSLARIAELIAQAEQSAAAGRHAEASARLSLAESTMLDALARMPGGNVVDYTPRFETPEEELRHEAERYGSYRRLVPIALAELRPGAEARASVDRLVAAASAHQQRGEAARSGGDVRAAIEAMRLATDSLQRALASAGLVVPSP